MSEKTPTSTQESFESKIEYQQFDAYDKRNEIVEELGHIEHAWLQLGGGEIDKAEAALNKAGDVRFNSDEHIELAEAVEDAKDHFYAEAIKGVKKPKSREEVLNSWKYQYEGLVRLANDAQEEWEAVGGKAVDDARAKLEALDMYTQPGEYGDAILELEDAEAIVAQHLESGTTVASTESNAKKDTPLKSNTEAAPKGERLADFLEAIRAAQKKNDAPTLKVLLTQYEEILHTKSDDKEWIDRQMSIARGEWNLSGETGATLPTTDMKAAYQALKNDKEASIPRLFSAEHPDKGNIVSGANVNPKANPNFQIGDDKKRPGTWNGEKKTVSELSDAERNAAKQAMANIDNANKQDKLEQTSNNSEKDKSKRPGRIRKLAKWATGLMSQKGIIERGQEKRKLKAQKAERKAALREEREAKIGARADEIYKERVAQHGQKGAYYEYFEPTMERAQKDAKKEFSRFRSARENANKPVQKVRNIYNVYTENKAKEQAEADKKAKEASQTRSTPETKPMPASEKPAPVTNINGENLSPADLNTTQPLSRPESSEGEQKAA